MTGEKSLVSNFIFNLIKTLMSILFPVITFAYASRVLSVDGIGKVNFCKSFILYFSMLAQLGMTSYGAREAAKIRGDRQRLSRFAHEMTAINLISTACSYAIFLILIMTVDRLAGYRVLLLVWSASILLNGLGMEWLYTALEEYRYITLRSLAFQAAALALLPVLVRDSGDTLAYAAICVLAGSGSYVLNFFHSRKYVSWRPLSGYRLKRHLKPIFLLFGFALSVNLYTVLDTTMLGFVSGDRAVGLYTAAEKVNKLVNSMITSLGAVMMPRLALYVEQGRVGEFHSMALKAYRFVFFCSVPAFLGLSMLAPEIILLFSGEDFAPASMTMRVLTPIVLVIPVSVLTNNQILLPMRQDRKILASACVGAVVNLLCNSLLMPRLAENGAAIGTVAAETVVMCICLKNAAGIFPLKVIFKGYWKYWLAALPIIPVYCWARHVTGSAVCVAAVTVLLGGGTYLCLIFLMGEETAGMIYKKLCGMGKNLGVRKRAEGTGRAGM